MTIEELKAALEKIKGKDPISKARRANLQRQICELTEKEQG